MSFDTGKILTGIGAILAGIGIFGYGILSIVGIILFLIGMLELAGYYNDGDLRRSTILWFVFGIVAAIILVVGIFTVFMTFFTHVYMFRMIPYTHPTALPALGTLILTVVLTAIFLIISAIFLRRAMDIMAKRSGESLFNTGGLLYLIGAILTFVVIGIFLVIIAWIIIGVAALSMRTPQQA